MFLLKKLLTSLILPPAGPVLLALFGVWLTGRTSRRWQLAGRWLAGLSLGVLLVLALPVVAGWLGSTLAKPPAVTPAQVQATQAIVILGGGIYRDAPEYGGDSLIGASLERTRYGAWLARRTGVPLLVTSGAPFGGRPEADVMAEILATEFSTPVRWIESRSRDTAENATMSAPLLKSAGVQRIALVSHPDHLVRAVPLFENQGFTVLPAPTLLGGRRPLAVEDFLPSAGTLRRSSAILHEYLGILYNHLTRAP